MQMMLFVYLMLLVVGIALLIWLYSKSGQRWLSD